MDELVFVVAGEEEEKEEEEEEEEEKRGLLIQHTSLDTETRASEDPERVPSATSPRPIIVRLLNTKTRDLWTKAARDKKLREKKIFVNEHLTTKNFKLLQSVKSWAKGNNHKYVWTKDCRILLRKDEKSKVKCIKSVRDLPNFAVDDDVLLSMRFPSGNHLEISDFE
ncbi:hypothetical protein M8J76_016825 [Diaphorina citri]|nr:hypothetical protein M8J76_016825 [Diaphorina citri]